MNLEINEDSEMLLTSAVDIPTVMENNLMREELIIEIPSDMEAIQWRECCIYKVPRKLRQVNKEAYTPKLISIGPFHHGENVLSDMEMLKVRYFKHFCDRTEKRQKEIAKIIEENEAKIRHCYAEIIKLNSEDFVKMFLVDSTFIIELFLMSHENETVLKNDAKEEDEKDYILGKPWLVEGIKQDLMLLENQLPFFILKELYDQIFYAKKNNKISFLDLACGYFSSSESKIPAGKEVKHFTDLIRYSYRPIKHNSFGDGIRYLCTAKKLSEAGVIFKLDKEGSALDIEFVKLQTTICPRFNCSRLLTYSPCLKCFGCLERMQPLLKMPRFEINDVTESLLPNIVALEQCHYPREAYVSNYMVLLDYLINTSEDVDLLVEKNIIVNKIGSNKAVATMVNKLGLEIVEENSCYTDLAKDLMNHCAQYGTFNMEYLRSTYFPNLWRGTATVVGLIVFGFSFWSTIRPYVTHQIESVHCV